MNSGHKRGLKHDEVEESNVFLAPSTENYSDVKKTVTARFLAVFMCFCVITTLFGVTFFTKILGGDGAVSVSLRVSAANAPQIDEYTYTPELLIPAASDYDETRETVSALSFDAPNRLPQSLTIGDVDDSAMQDGGGKIMSVAETTKKVTVTTRAAKTTAPSSSPTTNNATEPQATEPYKPVTKTPSDDVEILSSPSLDIVYYCQTDEKYDDVKYGTNTLSGYGCGPTNMAMVVSTLTDKIVSPGEMAKIAVSKGYWVRNVGSSYGLMNYVANLYGIPVKTVPKREKSTIVEALNSGKILVTVVGGGHFARSGHVLTIRGITDGGKLLVADSGSRTRSLQEWDYNTIISEIKVSYFWVYG